MSLVNRLTVLLSILISGVVNTNANIDIKPIVERCSNMTSKELYDISVRYDKENKSDSALVCLSLLSSRSDNCKNEEELKLICKGLHLSATIYFYSCDYEKSLELLLKALDICERLNYKEYSSRIYNSIGNVYSSFKEYDISKKYYLLAYSNVDHRDTSLVASVLNNIGTVYSCTSNYDSAVSYLEKTCRLLVDSKSSWRYKPLSNLGLANHRLNKFDKALEYYRKGLSNAYTLERYDGVASILSNIGQLYFDMKQYDSAKYYLNKSNNVAQKNGSLLSVIDNYKYLSVIEENTGNYKQSLEYNRQYMMLNDSIYNVSKYSSISEKQFVYEMSKIDKQMKELSAEQELKENKIAMQRRTQIAMIIIIVIAGVFLFVLFRKNYTLNIAYNKLVDRAIEIVRAEDDNKQIRQEYERTIKLQQERIEQLEASADKEQQDTSRRNYTLKDEDKSNILDAIETIMEDSTIFCDPEFSLEKLSEMINSNSNYVSQVINDSFGKNFRTYINEYRIKEALRLFSSPEHSKYSIETISEMVGFRSKSTFNKLFLKATGVTPSFYFKSLQSRS